MPDDFTLNIEKFAKDFEDGAEAAVRGATIKLWSAIIKATPVDSGRARGNWFATGKEPSEQVTEKVRGENAAISAAQRLVIGLKDWQEFTLTNNLPYINRLEYGWSKQAPSGMVRMSVKRFNSLIEEEAKKELPK